jgi:hypothetical protein
VKQQIKPLLKNNFMNQSIRKAAVVMAFTFALGTTYSFAAGVDGKDVNKEVKASFKHDFANAQMMSAEAHVNFTKVVFKMNEQVMTAFYATNGDLIAVTRNIVSSQLPVSLLLSFKKHYDSYWITDLFEMSQDQQSSYYLSLENADMKMTLRSNGDSWEVYSSVRK